MLKGLVRLHTDDQSWKGSLKKIKSESQFWLHKWYHSWKCDQEDALGAGLQSKYGLCPTTFENWRIHTNAHLINNLLYTSLVKKA